MIDRLLLHYSLLLEEETNLPFFFIDLKIEKKGKREESSRPMAALRAETIIGLYLPSNIRCQVSCFLSVPGSSSQAKEARRKECWKADDWWLNTASDSRLHGQPSTSRITFNHQNTASLGHRILEPSIYCLLKSRWFKCLMPWSCGQWILSHERSILSEALLKRWEDRPLETLIACLTFHLLDKSHASEGPFTCHRSIWIMDLRQVEERRDH